MLIFIRKTIFVLTAFCSIVHTAAGSGLPEVLIVPDNPTAVEKHAEKELIFFWQKAVGSKLAVHKNSDLEKFRLKKKIILGNINIQKKLADEEWLIAPLEHGTVLLAGGGDRGNLYAVYEFLERVLGIRFYGIADTFIPRNEQIKMPVNKITGKPYLPYRMMAMSVRSGKQAAKESLFMGRNRIQGPNTPGRMRLAGSGAWNMYGSPWRCHTFGIYTREPDAPKKMECYSLDRFGKRLKAVNGSGPGQPCLTHPEMIDFFKKKLRYYIEKDRKNTTQDQWPNVYNISVNDNVDFCRCQNCRKRWQTTGGPGGNDMEFINTLAEDIEKDYPDVIIETFAYTYSMEPSKIKPHKNVMVQFAALGREFSHGFRYTTRSLLTDHNRQARECLKKWSSISNTLSIWSYGIFYHETTLSPYTIVRGLKDDFSVYTANKVKSIYFENEITRAFRKGKRAPLMPSFADLKAYTFARLTIDPELDIEKHIKEFMENFYGPAAPYMSEYLLLLEKSQLTGLMEDVALNGRAFLSPEFFRKSYELMAKAEKAAAKHPGCLRRLRREYYTLDHAALYLKTFLPAGSIKIEDQTLVSRIKAVESTLWSDYYSDLTKKELQELKSGAAGRLAALLARKSVKPQPLPDMLKNRKVILDFLPPLLDASHNRSLINVNDPDAVGGKAVMLDNRKNYHTDRKFEYGVYHASTNKLFVRNYLEKSEIPQDEKYHWYSIKNVLLAPKSRFWAHWSWGMTPIDLSECYDGTEPGRRLDIYFSMKFTGPAYVKNSVQGNSICIDRVIAVESKQ